MSTFFIPKQKALLKCQYWQRVNHVQGPKWHQESALYVDREIPRTSSSRANQTRIDHLRGHPQPSTSRFVTTRLTSKQQGLTTQDNRFHPLLSGCACQIFWLNHQLMSLWFSCDPRWSWYSWSGMRARFEYALFSRNWTLSRLGCHQFYGLMRRLCPISLHSCRWWLTCKGLVWSYRLLWCPKLSRCGLSFLK